MIGALIPLGVGPESGNKSGKIKESPRGGMRGGGTTGEH